MILLFVPVGAFGLFLVGLSAMNADGGCDSSHPCDTAGTELGDAIFFFGLPLVVLVSAVGFIWALAKRKSALRWVGFGWLAFAMMFMCGMSLISAPR